MKADSPVPLPVEVMTSRQLARRARLIETVIKLVTESGSSAVQMRDVTERSGVALGTVYRYFRSKDHLVAVAVLEWQGTVTRRILASKNGEADALVVVKDFLRRALQAFDRAPGMAVIMMQMLASSDPDAREFVEQGEIVLTAALDDLLVEVARDDVFQVRLALTCVLWDAIKRMAGGRIAFSDALAQVEGVADILLRGRVQRSGSSRKGRSRASA
ncbi:TetR/AcrR family transcriptional regulator [Lentzea sp. NPDC051213]|uniref:TetR/AcrR family transcriptional regulator n=1 Tax=Lentzea sp. NPDC051213 TaxID=3364126 RepID=UPI0037B2BC22